MVVFLLLVIIAILLFGSSAVLGAIGWVLGAIVLVIAVALGASVAAQVPAWLWWTLGLLIGGAILALYLWDARQKKQLRRRLAEIEEQGRVAQDRIREDGIRRLSELRQASTITFHNDGLNKKKRKALRRRAMIEQPGVEDE
jgi:uncharacterized membrane protein YccC